MTLLLRNNHEYGFLKSEMLKWSFRFGHIVLGARVQAVHLAPVFVCLFVFACLISL